MKKFLSLILFAVFLLFFFAPLTYSAENFSTSYRVTYRVADDQNTRVTLDIGLRNKTSDYYAASYSVQTGFDDISNIAVQDGSGELKYKTLKNDKGSSVSFDFLEKTVGINNVHDFSLSFDTKEIAKSSGSVWEVNIPGISEQEIYSAFSVEVIVPDNFGEPSIIKPAVKDLKTTDNTIFFSKSELGKGGISIAYGTFQVYKFNLAYHLQNKNLFPVISEIAIPSDNNYQEVVIEDISPKPNDVTIDKDGNWLARYKLLPSQNIEPRVKGKARISYLPKTEELSENQKNLYLKPAKYWESNDPKIKELAKKLKTPEEIYKYVVENLKYDSSRIKEKQTRAGARNVLSDMDSAVCLEFTDLFVGLARGAGIPARAVEGYANTSNSASRPLSLVEDVLHAWPEYYDESKKTWVMVDPTWENTTKGIDYFNVLDFDHFAFVIKGEESDYPVPAGGYKNPNNKQTKDVVVSTTDSFESVKPSVTATTDFSENYSGGFPVEGNIIISNSGSVIAPSQTFRVSSNKLTPNSQNLYFDKIPPYGNKIIPIKFHSLPLLTNKTYTIKITIGQDTIEKQIIVIPFYKNLNFILAGGGIFLGSFLLILSIIVYRSGRISVSK